MHEDSRGRRARPVHPNALARASARPADPRHGGDDPRGRSGVGAPLLPSPLSPRPSRGRRGGQPPPRRPDPTAPHAHGHGSAAERTRHLRVEPAGSRACAEAVRPGPRQAKEDRAGPHLPRDQRAGAQRPRPLRLPRGEHRARGWHVLEALPGRGSGASPTPCTATTRSTRRPGCSPRTPARRRAAHGRWCRCRRELELARNGGLAEMEFERAKGHVKGAMVLSLEDPGGRMSRLGKSEIAHGEILSVDQALRRIDRVTLDDAHRVAERVLSQPMTLTVLGPFGASAFRGDRGQGPWRDPCRGRRGHRPHGPRGLPGGLGRPPTLAAAVSHSAPGSTLGQAIGLEGADAGLVLVEHLDAVRDAGIGVLVDSPRRRCTPRITSPGASRTVCTWSSAPRDSRSTTPGATRPWRDRRPELRDRRGAAAAVRRAGGAASALGQK